MTRMIENIKPSDTIVRIATLMALPGVLEKLGYDPADLFAEQGLQLSLFDNPENTISYVRRSQLIRHCVDKTGCQHLGHLISRDTDTSSLGLVGLFMQQSKDIASALRSFVRLTHLHVRGATVYLEEKDDLAFLGYSIIQPETVARDQIIDGAVTIAFNILRQLCGTAWQPLDMLFVHSKPKNIHPFLQFFEAPLSFNAERNGVLFSANWLHKPVLGANPKLYDQLKEKIDQLENQYNKDFTEQVRRVLHPALLTHQASADEIAALFSIHRRTMNRRLNACGTNFKELADECRFEITRQLLELSSMQLIQISEILDYADASAFTRAFRRWSGTTPSVWRERYLQANT